MNRPSLVVAGRVAGALVAVLLTGGGCASEEEPACVGVREGDVELRQGRPFDMPGGGRAGISIVDLDADPPTVSIGLGGAEPEESAVDLEVGDRFTLQGTAYEVRGFCAGSVSLRSR